MAPLAHPAAPATAAPPRAAEVLALLLFINVLNYFDRQLLGAVAEPVRREFHLGDGQLGLLSTAFTLIYAVAGLPLGRLCDRLSRARILAGGVLAFSLCTALAGLAHTYGQLFLARLLVGIGEASCAPAAAALCGDLFPRQQRARALSVFMLGLPLGVALSFGVSGPLARAYGWRCAFLLAGLPGLLCALWALRLPREVRGGGAAPRGASAGLSVVVGRLWRIPALGWLIVAGILHTLLMQVLAMFLSPFLMRCHGLDVRAAGLWSMGLFGLSGIPGLLLGGALGDRSERLCPGRGARLWVGAASSLLVALPLWLGLRLTADSSMVLVALLLAPACGLLYVYYSAVYATIQDIAPPDLRGTAMALYLFAMYVLGASLGPLAAGLLSDHYARQAALAAPLGSSLEAFRGAGLRGALLLLPSAAVALAGVLLLAARALRPGTAAAQSGALLASQELS